MTDRQTYVDLFERHADWHDDLAWIEVGTAADLVVDLEKRPAHPNVAFNDTGAPIGINWQNVLAHNVNMPTEDELVGEDG